MRLTSNEIARLTRAAGLLVSPFEHASVDGWRRAVNRELKELLGGGSAGFLLPGTGGPLMYSEEGDGDELSRYADLHPPSLADGTPIWQRLIEAQVSTMDVAYGGDATRYTRSAYYNEYAAPNGAADTLCAMLPLGSPDPRHVASVQLWRERSARRRFGERERQMLSLLFPSLAAGVQAVARWHTQRGELAHLLDGLGQAVLLLSADGRTLHRSAGLETLLAADAESTRLEGAMRQAAATVSATSSAAPEGRWLESAPLVHVRTAMARYRVRACLQRSPWAGGAPNALVTVERLTPTAPSPEELREAFALTPAETRVALLLAEGRSNGEIATRLRVSTFTARRHTERVLQKLGVTSRASVAARLLGTE